jgi:hypothetical protein
MAPLARIRVFLDGSDLFRENACGNVEGRRGVDHDVRIDPNDSLVVLRKVLFQDKAFLPRRRAFAGAFRIIERFVEADDIEAVLRCVGAPIRFASAPPVVEVPVTNG